MTELILDGDLEYAAFVKPASVLVPQEVLDQIDISDAVLTSRGLPPIGILDGGELPQ